MITCKDSVVEMEGEDKELCLDAAQILRALYSRFSRNYGEDTAEILIKQALTDSRVPEEQVKQYMDEFAKACIKGFAKTLI